MRLVHGVYEGPASYGVLRLAASMRSVHAVLRALPAEAYFPALRAALEKSGEVSPVTLSPIWRRPEDSRAPGNLARDLAETARRHPETEAIIVARSEAALLSGEEAPEISLPEDEKTGEARRLILCDWEAPGIGELEGADLALEDLVRAYARREERSPRPTVNLFGPPALHPAAEAEYEEAERLLDLIGIGVNARAPLGASPEDLAGLTRAWANVVLCRETGESATLYLQDEFGIPRVTTPMIGSAGTGAALRAVGALCGLEERQIRRAVWGELARTAKLPWYARLAAPETFRGRRAVLFGDFTRSLGLGYVLSREVGLEVAACGTYAAHLERDFLFHAHTLTDEAFISDDPEDVAARIEDTSPDLIVGTFLEEEVADSLGVPFLPLCAPAAEHPFVERPLVGYAGGNVLADALDVALGGIEERSEVVVPETGMPWTEEAMEELEAVPPFLRGRARRLAEEEARELKAPEVTREIFLRSRP